MNTSPGVTHANRVAIPAANAFDLEASIKRRLRKHVKSLGFRHESGSLKPNDDDKESYRYLHREHREQKLRESTIFLTQMWSRLGHHFADGSDVDPRAVQPRIEEIQKDTWQSDVFRLATLTWSPVRPNRKADTKERRMEGVILLLPAPE
jgi:uncharacterized protein DUF4338